MQVAFPDPDNTITTGAHIRILRGVEAHTAALACVRLWKLLRMPMPVIAIKLHDQPMLRQKGVNAELAANNVLWQIDQAQIVEQLIADSLNSCLVPALLGRVQFDQHSTAIGIGVAAVERTIQHLIGFSRRRPAKHAPAHLTGVAVFITTLPGDLMGTATKIMLCISQTCRRDINKITAKITRNLSACATCWLRRCTGTQRRAKTPTCWETIGHDLPTPRACDGSDFIFVFRHTLIIPHITAIIKPIVVTRYLESEAA